MLILCTVNLLRRIDPFVVLQRNVAMKQTACSLAKGLLGTESPNYINTAHGEPIDLGDFHVVSASLSEV